MAGEISNQGMPTPSPLTVDNILGHFEHRIDHSADPYEQLLARRVIDLVATDRDGLGGHIVDTIELSLQKHSFYKAPDHVRGYERSLIAQELWLLKPDFLKDIRKPADFDPVLHDAYGDIDQNISWHSNVFHGFIGMNTLTNEPNRGKIVKLEALLDNLPQPLKLIELGASQMHIGRKLALHGKQRRLAFTDLQVVTPAPSGDGSNTKYIPVRPDSKQLTTVLQRFSFALGSYVGVDENHPREPLVTAKMEGDRFYFAERADPKSAGMREFNILKKLHDLPGQKFYEADCSEPIDVEDFYRNNPEMGGGADVVLLSFITYEISPEDRAVLFDNAAKLLNPATGRAILIDHGKINAKGELEISNEQGKYAAHVYVLDNAKKELGWQHRMTLETGRAKKAIIEASFAELSLAKAMGLTASRPVEE